MSVVTCSCNSSTGSYDPNNPTHDDDDGSSVGSVLDLGSVPHKSLLDGMLLALWEECAEQGLFRYDVTACPTKVVPGIYGFVAQLNEGRALKKRPTEFRVDQVGAWVLVESVWTGNTKLEFPWTAGGVPWNAGDCSCFVIVQRYRCNWHDLKCKAWMHVLFVGWRNWGLLFVRLIRWFVLCVLCRSASPLTPPSSTSTRRTCVRCCLPLSQV